jgi:hypothetical protein
MHASEPFNPKELAALVSWSREPGAAAYSTCEVASLSNDQRAFMRNQVACIVRSGTWNGYRRPQELRDLLTDLRGHGLL